MPLVGGDRRKGGAGRGEDLDVEVGVGGQVLQHRQHPHGVVARRRARQIGIGNAGIDQEGLADRRILAEVLARRPAGEHQPIGRLERGVGISGEHRIGHDPEETGIGPDERFLEGLVSDLEGGPARGQTGRPFDLREIELELGRRHRGRRRQHEGLGARQDQGFGEAVDLLVAGNELLEAIFVAQIEPDQDRRGEADGQAGDGDGRVDPVAREVPQRGRDVVLQHGGVPSGAIGKGAPAALGRAVAAGAVFVGGPTNSERAWRAMAVRLRAGSRRPPGHRAAGWCAGPRRRAPASG